LYEIYDNISDTPTPQNWRLCLTLCFQVNCWLCIDWFCVYLWLLVRSPAENSLQGWRRPSKKSNVTGLS